MLQWKTALYIKTILDFTYSTKLTMTLYNLKSTNVVSKVLKLVLVLT